MSAVILIWNNNLVTVSHSYTGHASMLIGKDWTTSTRFVSWLPSDDSSKPHKLTIVDDLAYEGYAPDHILLLDTFDESKAVKEWRDIREKGEKYGFYRNNCSNMVSRVLRAGTDKGGVLDRHSLIWTPLKIKRWVLEIGGTKQSWDWLLAETERTRLITENEKKILAHLGRRDEKHGKGSTKNGAYYAKGTKIAPKIAMSAYKDGAQKFLIDKGRTQGSLTSFGGSIFSKGVMNEIGGAKSDVG